MEAVFIAFFALLGTVVASFLNVCCDRLPVGESLVVYPPSHCSACQRRLAPKDLIPVFSYLWLHGRCRYCQASIPRRILWVEIGTGVLFGFAYFSYGLSIELLVSLVYFCLFIVLLVIDLEHGLILNKIIYPALAVALVISIFLPPSQLARISGEGVSLINNLNLPQLGIAQAAIGGGIGLGLFLLVVLISRGGMGWGDVKMAALIGLVTGYLVFVALLMGIILGGLVAILLLALKIKRRREAIPFGPFLSLATIVTLLWGSDILSWYLRLF